jgi:hypothetical protein
MSRPQRYAFPAIYVSLLLPVLLGAHSLLKALVVASSIMLAALLNPAPATRVATLLLLAFGTLVPLLVIIQGSACWGMPAPASTVFLCVAGRVGGVLSNAAILGTTIMLVAANEWRGSLLTTVNGLTLPRSVRFVAVAAGASIGEFRRAAFRVHQAFTGRGEASPGFSWRNLRALPAMLAATWAAVLSGAAVRLQEQWAPDAFWVRYVPSGRSRLGMITNRDAVVMLYCGLVIAASIRFPSAP